MGQVVELAYTPALKADAKARGFESHLGHILKLGVAQFGGAMVLGP